MDKTTPILSRTEIAIREAFKDHPQKLLYVQLCREAFNMTETWDRRGVDPAVQAWAMCTHLAQMLSAQKICGTTNAALIDLMTDDVIDTVKGRSLPGVRQWLTPQ